MNGILQVDQLSCRLDSETIFHDVTFTLDPGEFLGVIGPNGAGKSTLLKIILGLMTASEGTVNVVCQAHRGSPASVIGYVPQSRPFETDIPIRVRDFISMGFPARLLPWLTRKEKKQLVAIMELTDTLRFTDKLLTSLSGGERQRVFLAQSLMRKPKILLLDESSANLDPGAEDETAQLVRHICKEQNVGVIFISHDLHRIAQDADRVLYLSKGRHMIGTTAEIMQSPILSDLYGEKNKWKPLQFHFDTDGLTV